MACFASAICRKLGRYSSVAMDGKKKGRVKVLEDGLAAQLADMRGDLTDKDLKDILRSARYVFTACYVYSALQAGSPVELVVV